MSLLASTARLRLCTLAAWAGDVPGAGDHLLIRSANRGRVGTPGDASALMLRGVQFNWRLLLAREGSRVVFLIFRHDLPREDLFEARLQFRVEPDPLPADPPTKPRDVALRVALPPFLVLRPTPEQIARFGPPGARVEDTVLLALGADGRRILAVRRPQWLLGLFRASLRYSELPGPQLDGAPWPIGPFLELTRAMRAWVSATTAPQTVTIPLPARNTEVREVLYQYLVAYCAARSRLAAAGRRPDLPGPAGAFPTHHRLAAFEGEVMLRLDEDGRIPEKATDDTIQLRMRFQARQGTGGPEAVVSVVPPDFLPSGELHERLRGAFAEAPELAQLGGRLGISDAAARQWIRAGRGEATIFRVSRSGHDDTEVMVQEGDIGGRPMLVMLRGEFRIESGAGAPEPRQLGTVKILYAGTADPAARVLSDADVRYFLRVIAALHRWGRLI